MGKEHLSIEKILEHYSVSIDGVIVNKRTGYVRRHQITSKGYHVVLFNFGNGELRPMKVSRLVALVYIPNENNLPEVNHIDGNKNNDYYLNLEWCTGRENKEHAKKMGLVNSLYTGLEVNDILMIRNSVRRGIPWKQIYMDYKMKTGWWNFRDICRCKTWKELL